MGQRLVFQTYPTRSVSLIAPGWTQWSLLVIVNRHPCKWYPRCGLIPHALVQIEEAPCRNKLLLRIIRYYIASESINVYFMLHNEHWNTYNTWDALKRCPCYLNHWLQQLAGARQWGLRDKNFRILGQNSPFETFDVHHCPFAFQKHDTVCLHTKDLERHGEQMKSDRRSRTLRHLYRLILKMYIVSTYYCIL